MTTDLFYQQLAVQRLPLGDLLSNEQAFQSVPADWQVIITDIKGSTPAVLSGRHQEVNLTATGSIVTVLNNAFRKNITIPFFFGGDGATFILPPSLIDDTMQALEIYQSHIFNQSGFELRKGIVPVSAIYAAGQQLLLAKFGSSLNLSIPVLIGNGLNYAEKIIKGADSLFAPNQHIEDNPDLSGMQCRWDRIPPPQNKDEVVTLLVIAREGKTQSEVFQKVINHLDSCYGSLKKRQPISVAKLRFRTSFSVIRKELRARLAKIGWLETFFNWVMNLYGPIFFRTRSGRQYLKALVEMSDTLVIDGKINTVISGTKAQRQSLQKFLDEMEAAGDLLYGLHVSGASVMSCYVRDLKYDHIHFVDGAEGGYTQAAQQLKAKLSG